MNRASARYAALRQAGRRNLTEIQVPAAARQFGCARFVYNHLLEFSKSRYTADKTRTSPAQCSFELTRLKTETPWLREVNAQSLQQTGRALDTAYNNWFASITGKRADKIKPPKFKKKANRQSARFTKGSFTLDKNGSRKHRWRRAAMLLSNSKESPAFRRGESSR